MLYHEELFTRSLCLNCRQEIPGIGIECGECSGNFRLCCEVWGMCFSVGAEIGQHKKEHNYHFFDSGSLALFPGSAAEIASSSKENNGSGSTINPRWSAREEIRLLDAIEQFGFGNWQDISKHIESRGPTDSKDEFVQRYVFGNIGKVSWAERNHSPESVNYEFKRNLGVFPQPIDHTVPQDEGPLSPSLTQRLPPLDISSDEMLQLGYMPYRDDYEKEYDNEAEKLVAQLNFTPEDDEVDIGLKLALVDMYSRRLRERARRKRVIRDYQLVCKFFKKDRAKASTDSSGAVVVAGGAAGGPGGGKDPTAKRLQSDEKQLYEKFQPFAQFYNCREFDHLVRNLAKEKDLKLRVQELFKYRNVGITKAEECLEFERSKINNSGGTPSGTPRKRGAAAAGLGTVDEEDEGRNHKRALILEQSPALIQQLLQPKKELGAQAGSGVLQNERSVGGNVSAILNPTQQPSFRGGFNLKNLESNGSGVVSLPQVNPRVGGGVVGEVVEEEVDLFRLKERQRGMAARFTADFVPCADLLTKSEFGLCEKLNLLPTQFLTIKLAFVLGRLDKKDPSDSFKDENSSTATTPSACLPPDMSPQEWKELLEFFASCRNKKILKMNQDSYRDPAEMELF